MVSEEPSFFLLSHDDAGGGGRITAPESSSSSSIKLILAKTTIDSDRLDVSVPIITTGDLGDPIK